MKSEPKFDFDVFISYSSRDKDWVRGELLQRIEKAGLKAFIDYRDFTRGAPSIKECERGVVECRKTLVILTPDYVKSEWCEIENIMAQTSSPANRDLRMIPLLKADCQKPLHIGALTHIDFTDGADRDLAWRQLLTALGAPPEQKPPPEPQRAGWFLAHPYPMPPNFTGRVAERAFLTGWLNDDPTHPLLSLRALGGFGKSALVWHWLTHDVSPADWPRVVWWSFYEGDASFDYFLAETLDYLGTGGTDPSFKVGKAAVDTLLKQLSDAGTLLILDGFERALRAFGGLDAAYRGDEEKPGDNDCDCISPLAEDFLRKVATLPQFRSKVLLTTRLRPRIAEAKGGDLLVGCCEEELKEMQPADAVAFFHAQGIRGTHTEIEVACAPYGYHPLSLRLLAGLIVRDLQHPGDIAAARRLDVTGDLVQRRHHVLEVAYNSLSPARRTLLGHIACFRSPITHDALGALAAAGPPLPSGGGAHGGSPLGADLHDLVARGLLHHDRLENRFDLHPIVRRYAYDRLNAPDRTAAHTRLRDYFAAVPQVDNVTRLADLAPVIELYHHTVRAGQLLEAQTLFRNRLHVPLYYQLGAYQLIIDLLRPLFPDGEDCLPRLKDKGDQAWTLNELANAYSLNGQPLRSVGLFELSAAIDESRGDKSSVATVLQNAAGSHLEIGALGVAEAGLRRSIALARDTGDDYWEANGHRELARLLAYRGAYAESKAELETATPVYLIRTEVQGLAVALAVHALRELLYSRCAPDGADQRAALASARCALESADMTARTHFSHARDYVAAHWLLGAAYRVAGQTAEAEQHLHEALQRCRRINLVELEADILIDLARLRAATGAPDEAQRLAEEALLITDRSGYVLQGADARLELAKLALARGDQSAAQDHAQQAKTLATCDGPPDYTYKAAYTEADALLKRL